MSRRKVGDSLSSISARASSIESIQSERGIARRRIGELQEMQENAPHLAAHGVALAIAQILDLLGEVLAVEAVVGSGQGAQHLGLVLRPGVEIVLVIWSLLARSVRHFPILPAARSRARRLASPRSRSET